MVHYCRVIVVFTKVKLKNFRSFDNIEFDLTGRNAAPKHLAIVYGENGAGKSNLMSAFVLLNELMQTMDARDAYEKFISQNLFNDESLERAIRQRVLSSLRDIQAIIADYRMVGSTAPIEVEYQFSIDGKFGKYSIELGESEITHECLEYTLNKRKGTYFECSAESFYINPAIVQEKDLLFDIRASAKRYWGKHSFLAIVLHEIFDKSKSYGLENISDNFNDVLEAIDSISCNVAIGARSWKGLNAQFEILEDASYGKISKENEFQLDVAERVLSRVFPSINSSIRRAYYKREYSGNTVNYQLFFEKMIAGCYRDIAFSKESTGNHQILTVLCYMLNACIGGVSILDEADSGIHDYLFHKIVEEIHDSISGQLIMTTHNTLVMESTFARDSTYIIRETEDGSKDITCVSNYEKRTYLNNNIKKKYLNNEYGGLPTVSRIDFESLIDDIKKL